ncbi:hypothetical protein LTR16_007015, partial [Cryomyces antarcticus]
GYLLHPGIIRTLQPESRIADLATGTGSVVAFSAWPAVIRLDFSIWLRDVAKEVPLFLNPLRTNPDTFAKALSYGGKTVFHILGNRGWLGNGYMERFSLFRTCGLVHVCEDTHSTHRFPETRAEYSKAASAGFLSAQRQLIKSGLLDWSDKQVIEARKSVLEEIEKGAYLRLDICTVLGRKPQW